MLEKFDTIVIGAGVSGLTAALYLLRAGKNVLVLEKETIGGQIAKSPRVENFPSIKSISGMEFSNNLYEQVESLGGKFEFDEVNSIEKVNDYKFIVHAEFDQYEAKSIILATGVDHKKIGVPHEDELVGQGVSYCATCDGAFFEGQDVVLIGDANSALQYALLLSQICNKVYMNLLFDKFFGDEYLVKQVLAKDNIIVTKNISLKEFKYDDNGLNGLIFENTQTHELVTFEVKGCFIAIGQIPNNERFSNLVELQRGYIVTNENMETKTPGVYACGDTRVKKVRQLTTACNDGAIAACNAIEYLNNLDYKLKTNSEL